MNYYVAASVVAFSVSHGHHQVQHQKVSTNHRSEYLRAYQRVVHRFGPRTPGRNLIRDGAKNGVLTDREVTRSLVVLRRMLHPVPVATVSRTVPSSVVYSTTTSTTSESSPLPACTWQPESGGDPTDVNPQSGAGGYYQILPSTWAAMGGTGLPQDAPMSEQTAIAERIAATQGLSAWVNC
jgi:hypothetical protein